MLRKIFLSAMSVSLFASIAGASVDLGAVPDFDVTGLDVVKELSEIGVPSAEPAAADLEAKLRLRPSPAEWTIMVYANGKNDLEPYLLKDLNEMEMIGSRANVNVVVQAGRIDGYDESDGDWKGVRRYRIRKDVDPDRVSSPVLQRLGKVDMGDYKSLAAFGKWAKAAYPARKYMLIVWNHGSGWEKGLKRTRIDKGISYDDETGNHISTPQLGKALKAIGKVDVLGTDACLMQMVEVAYEIKDFASYIVGSEETEPGDGYTYNDFLAPVAVKPAMSPYELARVAVDAYSDHYKAANTGSTQSVLKADSIPMLKVLADEFAAAMMKSGEKALAKTARDGSVNYAIAENRDLHHFVRLVVDDTKSDEVKKTGQALMSFITTELVMHNRTNNDPGGLWSGPKDYSNSMGIAAYFPNFGLGEGYEALQWAKASQWDEFVNWINQP